MACLGIGSEAFFYSGLLACLLALWLRWSDNLILLWIFFLGDLMFFFWISRRVPLILSFPHSLFRYWKIPPCYASEQLLSWHFVFLEHTVCCKFSNCSIYIMKYFPCCYSWLLCCCFLWRSSVVSVQFLLPKWPLSFHFSFLKFHRCNIPWDFF